MKFLLIGGGSVASVVCNYFLKNQKVKKIICLDIDPERAKKFIEAKDSRITLEKFDASGLPNIVKEVDIILNCSTPKNNIILLKIAADLGKKYLDLDSHLEDLKTAEQLGFHKQFEKASTTALINAGVAPGLTNLLVAHCAEEFDHVTYVKIRLLEDQRGSHFVLSWSPSVLIDEVTSPPLFFRNGTFVTVEQFGEEETFEFPAPIGKQIVCNIYGDEIATLPLYVKADNFDFKCGGADIDFVKILASMELLSKEPLTFKGQKIVPLEYFSQFLQATPTPQQMQQFVREGKIAHAQLVLSVELEGTIKGKRTKKKASVIFPEIKKLMEKFPGVTYISWPTGVCAYAFAMTLASMNQTGVFPPECLTKEQRVQVLSLLKHEGISIIWEKNSYEKA